MTQAARCPRCGATIPPGRMQCPACIVELGLAVERPSEAESESPSRVRQRRGPPPTPLELAADFPQLEIAEVIGEGGMGVVYRAQHKQLGRDVALKILAAELADDPRFEERFLREARALAKLDHTGIVHVYDVGRAGKRLFLLMEFVDGTNLRRLIKGKQLTAREALAIVPQICEALQYAHDEGVVHRDIKPENVLIDAKGRVKLADFGLAKLIGVDEPLHTATGVALGTAHYVAPEQLSRPRDVDHRADIYSLGVVFYEMLTGELPLGRFEAPSKRVQVDVRLDEIVLKSLERAPERRYQHAVEVKTDVDELASRPQAASVAPQNELKPKARRAHEQGVEFVLYVLAWIAIGVAFNYGPVAFFAASALLALLAARGQTRAAQRGEVRWTRLRKTIALALFPVGFAFLFAGAVALAEADTRYYDSGFDPDRAVTGGLDRIHADLVAAADGFSVPLGPIRVLTKLDGPGRWRHGSFVLLGLGIWFAALSLPNWKRRSYALIVDGAPALRALLAGCFPLALIVFAMRVAIPARIDPRMPQFASVDNTWETVRSVEDAASQARTALLTVGYQVHTEFVREIEWAPNDEPISDSTPQRIRVLYADVPDVFQRLRVSRYGLQRALPTVTLFLCARQDGRLAVIQSVGEVKAARFVSEEAAWSQPAFVLALALDNPSVRRQ